MSQTRVRFFRALSALVCAGLLTACGGDEDAPEPAPEGQGERPPASEVGPPTDRPPEVTPPSEETPEADPPEEDPPEEDPPEEDPPEEDPPEEDPPEEDPPEEDPPEMGPPEQEPPEVDPPEQDPPASCPEGIICLTGAHFRHQGDTRAGVSERHSYPCAPDTDESGAEIVYRLDVEQAGFLALELSDMEAGADVDVHLLHDRGGEGCVARGHWRAGAMVEPGQYWIVADTWVNGDGVALPGSYTITGHLTTAADLAAHGIDPRLAGDAVHAFGVGWAREDTDRFEYVITDFSLHSAERRQWVLDLVSGELLWLLHVAHGEASSAPDDLGWATRFSNIPESHQSSLGMLRSAEAYFGDFGRSFRLDGLEPGFNDNVRRRDIVMHPWDESRPEYVAEHGIVGTSWGCPAVDDRLAPEVVDALAEGVLMLFWHPESEWHQRSLYMP